MSVATAPAQHSRLDLLVALLELELVLLLGSAYVSRSMLELVLFVATEISMGRVKRVQVGL